MSPYYSYSLNAHILSIFVDAHVYFTLRKKTHLLVKWEKYSLNLEFVAALGWHNYCNFTIDSFVISNHHNRELL
jgi:hypothetical protein